MGKKVDAGNIAVGSFLFAILLTIIMFFMPTNENLFYLLIFLIGLSIFVMVLGCVGIIIQKNDDKNELIANINAFQNEYDNYIKELGITKSDIQVTLFELTEKNDIFPVHIPHYLWIDNDMLNLFPMPQYYKEWEISSSNKPDVSKLKLKTIPIESILYFEEIGELRKYTTLSGGGTSLKGASCIIQV